MARKQRAKPEAVCVPVPFIARTLGLSVTSTYKAIRAGEIPAAKIGSRYLVARSVLERLLREAGVEAESGS